MAAFVPSDEGLCAIDRSVRRGLAVGSFLHWSMVTDQVIMTPPRLVNPTGDLTSI
jgi:hypothetical protein